MPNNSNKIAVITGAAKCIGREMTKLFHQHGFDIAVHYNSSEQDAADLAKQLNDQRANSAKIFRADLDKTDEVLQLAENCIDHFGRIDILINNASTFYPTPLGSAEEKHWDNLFGSNVKAPFFLAQAFFDSLKDNNGSIINIADIYAERPKKDHTIYCIAKAGNVMLTKSLALEMAPGVRVNGIAPGAMLAPVGTKAEDTKEIEGVPLNKFGGAKVIAEAAYYLAAQAEYTTGQILAVDGGKSLII